MKTDVQTLIAALTTERNSLDRAISALQAIAPEKSAAPIAPVVRRRKITARTAISNDVKRAASARMSTASSTGGNLLNEAKAVARQYAVNYRTVYTSWRTWSRLLDAVPVPSNGTQQAPVMELATV